ncbi:MAG TPA: DUF3108 domain-containing protein [Ramlibacter sp.]|uniref:DUF3108 domain-containing protein n=1 Tax=Ramlibacter sp. TaxID=1917967 RepID=UPI002D4761BD|nr:DUF3108 domain-containing protein [Ramlibacter sp.]HZY17071.1 DUF3108 domain-containing protein [Ramlibacter sp.]
MLDLLRPPAPALWRYDVAARHRGSLLAGQATLHWRHDGDHYEALAQWSLPSLPGRRQLSTGALSAQGLAPTRFSDRLRSEEAAHFDRAGGRIVFSSNRPDAPLRPGSQDRLSVLLQLASLVGGAPQRFMPGAVVVVPTGTRDAADWRFVVEDFETLALPAGTVRALRITRAPEREYDLRIELWLAPGADYAPVRLRLTTPNGDWLDWQWSGTDKG